MRVSEIKTEKGSAQTFYSFVVLDHHDFMVTVVDPADYYWTMTDEGIKLAFRNQADAQSLHKFLERF